VLTSRSLTDILPPANEHKRNTGSSGSCSYPFTLSLLGTLAGLCSFPGPLLVSFVTFMIQTPQSPAFYSNSPMYERPPARLEHRTTARTNVRTPGDLVRSWEAFDRLFEDAFAPSHQATEPDRSETQSQFTEDNQTQSAFDTPKPQGGATRQLYDETPQSEFTQLYDDGATEMTADTETPLPGRYPRSYPLPDDTPQSIRAPFPDNGGGADEIASSADEDFQRLWEEAERNRRKRMTRTVTRRRILQHGVMSPSGTVSTIQPEPEQKLRRKKSRYVPHSPRAKLSSADVHPKLL